MKSKITDICIIGSGIVGLTVAYQLKERYPAMSITVIEKESEVGLHSSGRNSGVLHAGLYYQPGTLKAKVCVNGAKRLRSWCRDMKLPVMDCGKIITPQRVELDQQLEVLLKRGKENGATVELIDQQQFYELAPDCKTSSGRALWSPDTSVVKPILIIHKLKQQLQDKGVSFILSQNKLEVISVENSVLLNNKNKISYGHVFNCAGLQADRVAHKFNIGEEFTMLPFKGSYWKLRKNVPFRFNTNIYPVPDLEVPFLGVHITPSIDGDTYIGPTATPALGRENYVGLQGVEPYMALEFIYRMVTQAVVNSKMRKYIYDQAFEWVPYKFLRAAKLIVPKLEMNHIESSAKVGIRPQLYNKTNNELVQDFVVLDENNSTHVINAISPAFSASFELADYILDNSKFN